MRSPWSLLFRLDSAVQFWDNRAQIPEPFSFFTRSAKVKSNHAAVETGCFNKEGGDMNLHSPMQCPHMSSGIRGISRRRFLGTAAGLAVGAGVSTTLGAQRGNPHRDASPKPIPGGVSPFGVFIHHFPIAAPGTPLSNIAEPSQITDFNGFVGLNRIRGFGSGTGFPSLSFQADMGFMVGEYVAMDGKHYNASFGFI